MVAGIYLKDIDDQQVARLSTFDMERAGQHVHAGQWRIAQVVSRIVILDGAVKPLPAIRAKDFPWLDSYCRRYVGVPTIVTDQFLILELLRIVKWKQILRHFNTSQSSVVDHSIRLRFVFIGG